MKFVDVANVLAAQAVTFEGVTIPAWRLDEVRDVPQSADLPHRLILPPGANGVKAFTDMQYVSGKNIKMGVQVVDLLLWRTAGTAPNLDEAWPQLAMYCDAYMRHMLDLRFVAGGMVTDIAPTTAVFEWPHKSNRFYHGAQIVVRVEGWLCLN
jgi:hypothetical protein